ncbi:MAG: hypothetical protein EOO42_02130 [Flavobacteriales bacterium]|nr:MAG: hypothetical protein EOO42_02130 [Flavobacteriales bacterium]
MLKKHILLPLILVGFALGITSCKKKRFEDQTAPTEIVYAVGRDGYVATYWKNGVATQLGTTAGSSDANALVLNGNDVYISGYQIGTNGKYVARYWKNGVGTDLTDGTKDAMANDIVIVGTDIFIAGQETNGQTANWKAKYWKNGVPVTLSSEAENAVANGIAVVGQDVYVIGTRREPSWLTGVTCYWKNGQVIDLADRSTAPSYQAIVQSEGQVHMGWSTAYNNLGQSQSFYSKNMDVPIMINDGTSDATMHGITISGSDTYLAGWGIHNNAIVAKYWKNGNQVLLSDGSKSAFALAIAVYGNDVYVAGDRENPQSGKASIATYWKNGTAISLSNGNSDALVRDIAVSKN